MNPIDILNWLNQALGTEGLNASDRELLLTARNGIIAQFRNQGPFVGEQLEGGMRNIPGAEGGVVIQPQQVPGGHMRSFVPNPAIRMPGLVDPRRLGGGFYYQDV